MAAQTTVAVAFSFYALAKLRGFHDEQTTEALQREAVFASARFQPLLAAADRESIQPLALSLAERTGTRITVMLPAGTVIADSDRDPAMMDNHRLRPEMDRALTSAEGEGSAVRFSATLGVEMVYVARSVGDVGVVRVALPLTAVDAQLASLVRALAVAGLIWLALTFGVVYLVSRQTTHAVRRLARGASRFARGNLKHRIVRPASSELAAVADAFNRMAGQLESHIATLRSQQNEQRAILQSMSNGVIALDAEQRVLSMNRAAEQLLGIDGLADRGRLIQEVLREPQLHGFVAEAMAAQRRLTGELTLGSERGRIVQATAEPLEADEAASRGLLIVLNDVTQLRRLEKIRSDFAANVSHELRTPITNIKGYLETVMEYGDELPAETRNYLGIIHRNAERLAAIIEDLLALARLEEPESRLGLERVETDLSTLIETVLGQFRQTATEKGITLVPDAPPHLAAAVNPRLIEQAITNLVSNAVKYGPTRSRVTVSAALRDGELSISVTDQGPGIPAAHLPRLFERFYRVDKARSREQGGTGLGLAIVKHIASVHGGRAEVESRIGRGSTFRLVLPMAALAATEPASKPVR
jgi:two-component system phosphate regulon sensor histidine kinase PhoR